MARRKRYIKGRVFITNDRYLTGHHKPYRRVVAVNNNPNEMHVRRITKIENGGRNARKGTPIEIYPDIPKPSVVENKTFRRTTKGKKLKLKKHMKPTRTRLNKWDRAKLKIK